MHVGSVLVLYYISFCHRTKSVHNVHILMLTLNCIKDVSRRQDSLLGEQNLALVMVYCIKDTLLL